MWKPSSTGGSAAAFGSPPDAVTSVIRSSTESTTLCNTEREIAHAALTLLMEAAGAAGAAGVAGAAGAAGVAGVVGTQFVLAGVVGAVEVAQAAGGVAVAREKAGTWTALRTLIGSTT